MNPLTLLETKLAGHRGLFVKMNGGTLEVGPSEGEAFLFITPAGDRWTLATPEAHCHFPAVEEAMEVAVGVIRGEIRTAIEYRSNTIAATWMEERVDEVFEMTQRSMYLCPFDADDWTLRSGESWRTVRTTRTYQPETGTLDVTTFERTSDVSQGCDMAMTKWLDDGLGKPESGLRWTLGHDNRFVLQAPTGWRRVVKRGKAAFVDFSPETAGLLLRVQHFYRDAIQPLAEPDRRSVSSSQIQFEAATGEAPWMAHKWTLIFTDGENDLMAIIELFYLADREAEATSMIDLLSTAASKSLFVPSDWNMQRE